MQRDPGFCKLNTLYLTETEYVNLIKSTITNVQDEYKGDDSVSPALLWDMIKLKIRETSLFYVRNKSKQTREREAELEKMRLEKDIDQETTIFLNNLMI